MLTQMQMQMWRLFLLATLVGSALGAAVPDDENRRTGSGSGSGLLSLVGSKISSIAQASSGLSSSSSSSSEGQGGDHGEEYGHGLSYGQKSFDFWSFKRAILSSLLQAVKAIKGGIIALKGQLIKAKGHVIATKGRLLVAKGDAITDFGKQVATKALLSPASPQAEHAEPAPGPVSGAYGAPPVSSYSSGHAPGPAGYAGPPPPVYGPPVSGPSEFYGPFNKVGRDKAAVESKPAGVVSAAPQPSEVQAGLLLLKPIHVPHAPHVPQTQRTPSWHF